MQLGAVRRVHRPHAALAQPRVVLRPGGGVVAQLAVLDDRVADVDPEARDPALEPEAQDVVEGVAHAVVPPVQVGLAGQELVQVVLAGLLVQRPRRPAERRAPVVGHAAAGRRVRPDVEVAVRSGPPGKGVLEPGVAIAGVVRDQIEEHADAAIARVGDQRVEILERAQIRVHSAVVGHVVAPVVVRRGHRRVQPDPVDIQPREMIQARANSLQIADSVVVGVRERAWVKLVKHAVPPPRMVRHGSGGYEPTGLTAVV